MAVRGFKDGFLALAMVLPLQALSQTPADFESMPVPSGQELVDRLSGQVWSTRLGNGSSWRMDFRANGYMYLDVSTGARDSARWRAENGQVCMEFRRFPSGCAPWRMTGDRLYLKRSTGEVLTLEKQ